jgi:uncharacterized protein YlxW (UPF0749 family)
MFNDFFSIAREFGIGFALTIAAAAMLGWLFRAGTVNAVRALGETIASMKQLAAEREQDNSRLREEIRRLHMENAKLHREVIALRDEIRRLQRIGYEARQP